MSGGGNGENTRSAVVSALEPTDSALSALAVRSGAVAALAMLAALSFTELGEIRGELAFARFLRLKGLAEMTQASGDRSGLASLVQGGSTEAELVMRFGTANPDALRSVSAACMVWSAAEGLDPLLRLRLGEKAVTAAALAVRAAPSDYEHWLLLARAEASLGLWEQAQLCQTRAQELAPPGKVLPMVSSGT